MRAPHMRGTSVAHARHTLSPPACLAAVQEWHGAAKTGQLACLARLLAAEPWLLHNRSEKAAEQQPEPEPEPEP